MADEDISRIRKQVEQIKNEKEAVIKTLQAQRARFHDIQEKEEDELSLEASSSTISNLDVANKITNFIKWNTNLSLIEAEIVDNYKNYVDELLEYIEGVANNEEQLIEIEQELEAASKEKEKLLTKIDDLEGEVKELKKAKPIPEAREEPKKIRELGKVAMEIGPPLTGERKKEIENFYYKIKSYASFIRALNPQKHVLNTKNEIECLREIDKKIRRFKGQSGFDVFWARKRAMQDKNKKNLSENGVRFDKSVSAKNSKRHIMGPPQEDFADSSDVDSAHAHANHHENNENLTSEEEAESSADDAEDYADYADVESAGEGYVGSTKSLAGKHKNSVDHANAGSAEDNERSARYHAKEQGYDVEYANDKTTSSFAGKHKGHVDYASVEPARKNAESAELFAEGQEYDESYANEEEAEFYANGHKIDAEKSMQKNIKKHAKIAKGR